MVQHLVSLLPYKKKALGLNPEFLVLELSIFSPNIRGFSQGTPASPNPQQSKIITIRSIGLSKVNHIDNGYSYAKL